MRSDARKRLEQREGRDHWEHHDAETRTLIQRAKAEAWDEGHDECCAVYIRHCASAVNPYRSTS